MTPTTAPSMPTASAPARRGRSIVHAPLRGAIALQPSILSADFMDLQRSVAEVTSAGVGSLHVDVMDGRFVPNLSIGLPVLAALAGATDLDLDVHLMIVEPERYLAAFAAAGADALTVHVEATPHIHRCLEQARGLGVRVGLALNPGTPLDHVRELLPLCDQVLVMTVNPGFGGQSFIRAGLERIARLRRWIDEAGLAVEIQVDGGIAKGTMTETVRAGARWLVAGSAVYASSVHPAAAAAELIAEGRAALPVG